MDVIQTGTSLTPHTDPKSEHTPCCTWGFSAQNLRNVGKNVEAISKSDDDPLAKQPHTNSTAFASYQGFHRRRLRHLIRPSAGRRTNPGNASSRKSLLPSSRADDEVALGRSADAWVPGTGLRAAKMSLEASLMIFSEMEADEAYKDAVQIAELYRLGLLYENEGERGEGFTMNSIEYEPQWTVRPAKKDQRRHKRNGKGCRKSKVLGTETSNETPTTTHLVKAEPPEPPIDDFNFFSLTNTDDYEDEALHRAIEAELGFWPVLPGEFSDTEVDDVGIKLDMVSETGDGPWVVLTLANGTSGRSS